jgi:hypothetical protein
MYLKSDIAEISISLLQTSALWLSYTDVPTRRSRPRVTRPALLEFVGPRGHWATQGRQQHDGSILFPLDGDDSLFDLLTLLNGGTLTLRSFHVPVRILVVQTAGDEGQAWFDCARAKIL